MFVRHPFPHVVLSFFAGLVCNTPIVVTMSRHVHGEYELAHELTAAGGRLVVVDFYADW